MNKRPHTFLKIAAVCASFAVLLSLFLLINLIAPVSFNEKWKDIEIPDGVSYSKGLEILQENDIIKSRIGLLLLGKLTKADKQLKPGFYVLSASMSPLKIFGNLINGKTIQLSITIPEGSSLRWINEKLVAKNLVNDKFLALAYDPGFLASLGIDAPSIEGYIYPDTYNFHKGIAPDVLLKLMVQRLREVFNEPLKARAAKLGMTENQVLTLASIIEREAVFDSERPIISAVYHNRLKRKMKLQADPTVLYDVTPRPDRIRYRDLRRVTPYNTYVIKGLPPGPISSPGIKSIEAALYPDKAKYLYFVSMNNGEHFFSLTGAEHLKAVAQYQQSPSRATESN